jgi:hypothetical protein
LTEFEISHDRRHLTLTAMWSSTMDEVIPGLWIGDISSAHDVEKLKAHGIFSILTAMRGKITIHEVRGPFPLLRSFLKKALFFERHSFVIRSCWTIVKMQTF